MQYKITEWITAGYLAILKDKKEKKNYSILILKS